MGTPCHPGWWCTLIAAVWLSGAFSDEVTASVPLRAVVLVDTSGSMRLNDPQHLSVAAARLFLSLARPEDALGVVAFSDRGVSLAPLTPLAAPTVKDTLHALLTSLTFTGQTTDLAAALEAGLASFPPPQGASSRDVVLLLTDGKLDLGRQRRAEEAATLAHIRQTLVPQYRHRGIALYTIAFTEASDQALLQDMAQHTDGAFAFVSDAMQLHVAFSRMLLRMRQMESVPLINQTLLLDDSITEASLVFSKRKAQEPITLITPGRHRLHAGQTQPGVTWSSTPAYELVHLTHPEPGAWQVDRPDTEAESLAVVGSSTLQLQITLQPAFHEAGDPLVLQAFLAENGRRLQAPQQRQDLTMHAELSMPQGHTAPYPLTPHPDGTFVTTLRDLPPGAYQVRVAAISAQLHRQQVLPFTVHPPCFQPHIEAGDPVTVRVTLTAECPAMHDLILEAGRTIEGTSPVWLPLRAAEPGGYTTTLPPRLASQQGEVTVRIRGQLDTAGPFTVLKGPWPLPTVPVRPLALSGTALMLHMFRSLVFLNGALLLAGGSGYGVYVMLRRRRSHANS